MAAEKFRMDAYYFGFTPTGVEVIDLILSAVACAGKAYHHTDQWTEATEPWHDKLRGSYPAEWIQRAAEDAAKQLDEAHSQLAESYAAIRRQHGLIEQLWRYADHRRGCVRVMLIEIETAPCTCGFDEITAVMENYDNEVIHAKPRNGSASVDEAQAQEAQEREAMRLLCTECGKSVSTEVPDQTIVRAALKCPECIEAQDIPRGRRLDEAHAAIREVPRICLCAGGAGICGFCLWREKHAPVIARASEANIRRASSRESMGEGK